MPALFGKPVGILPFVGTLISAGAFIVFRHFHLLSVVLATVDNIPSSVCNSRYCSSSEHELQQKLYGKNIMY